MSLYIGHLSPRIRREELERNFRRFGRCSVQLKDGYGFVVYELTANAERALRALRGKIICGEQISINWSNRQPKPFQRSAKSSRFYEPYCRRNFRDGDDGVGISGPRDGKEFPRNDHGGRHSNDAVDREIDEMDGNVVNAGENKSENMKEMIVDQQGIHDPTPVENDRWDEPGNDTLAGNGLENGDEFDCYEPYHGYNRRDENENFQKAGSYDSSDQGNSQEKRRREKSTEHIGRNIDMPKPQQTCYNCGQAGHIMRRCPRGGAHREKFKFMKRRDETNFRDKGNMRLKRFKPNLWGKSDSYRNSHIPSRLHTSDRKEFYPDKATRVPRESEISPESKGKQQAKFRGYSQRNMSSRVGKETRKKSPKRSRKRKSHSSDSSTTSSQSHSQSKRSRSGTSFGSHSRLAFSRSQSRSRSASSSSRSSSTPSYSKSVNSRSRSRSRSKSSLPRSLSLSVSLEHKSTPFSKNKQIDVCSNGSSENNLETSSKQKQLEDTKLTGTYVMLEGDPTIPPFKVDTEINGEQPVDDDRGAQCSTCGIRYSLGNSCGDMLKDGCLGSEHHSQMGSQQIMPSKVPKRDASVKCEGSNSLCITSEEMVSALKHYGLTTPKEGQLDIPVEEYFGAARLWPWQLIYYRRLKKGPISTENYARRLEQNREFGIVDKYIRSSSGWNECHQSST
ncbi:uncharacterized protein [Typha latifolia]|uniref:uncharacterized protein n=1 Tax=Typha latifolia TaxID=4733 RepID=UPI003C2C6738